MQLTLNELTSTEGETKLVFAHGGVIRVLVEIVLKQLSVDEDKQEKLLAPAGNCAVYRLSLENGTFTELDIVRLFQNFAKSHHLLFFKVFKFIV